MTDTFDDQNNNKSKNRIRILIWLAVAVPIIVPVLANLTVYKGTVLAVVSKLFASLMPSVTKLLYTSHTYIF